MVRIFLPTAFAATALFAALVGLIRAQPFDDRQVRDFLAFLDECAAPCWQGVRPGVTTTTSALVLLEAHNWVSGVDEHIWFSTPGSSLFSWLWNGQQPHWINDQRPGVMTTRLNRIQSIKISTHISLGELWLSMPEQERIERLDQLAGTAGEYIVRYPARGFEAHIPLSCPLHLGAFWQSNAELYFVDEAAAVDAEWKYSRLICRNM